MNNDKLDRRRKSASVLGGVDAMITAAWHGRSMHCIGVIAGHISTMASKNFQVPLRADDTDV